MTTTPDPAARPEADKRRIKLKALIVQMNEANDGLSGMALLAMDVVNHRRYSEKFFDAYHAALDLLEPKP